LDMEEPVVILDGLTYTYAGSETPAIKDIDLTVRPGEFVTITGPSGCGKSTLSFCLTGFIPHSFDGVMEGKATIGGSDTRSCTPGELAGIVGLVQQDPESQLCTLKVIDEIAFGPENICLPSDEIKERVDWALSAVGLSGLTERAVHTLSGGEKQRLAIASVLAMRPQLLILDEPTANLDPRGCREVLTVIKKLHQELKTAIIVIEHRLQYLLPFSDRLILIEDGKITSDHRPHQFHRFYPTIKAKDNKETGSSHSAQKSPHDDGGHRGLFPLQGEGSLALKSADGADSADKEQFSDAHKGFPSSDGAAVEAGMSSLKDVNSQMPDDGSMQQEPSPVHSLLSVEDITVKYEQKTALNRISFSLYPGETVAVMGDNGCGKTTLLNVLLGIHKPDQGQVYFDGEEITGCGVTKRAQEMGLTSQNPNHQLFERTVIREASLHSQFLARDLEHSLERVEQLLDEFDLASYREQVPFALSLGEKKRLTLVSVLAYQPRILLLDEPLVGQDQERLELLLDTLSEHRRQGGLTVMVCHEPLVVESCCQRVLFFDQGNLILDCPTEEAFAELARKGRDEYLPQSYYSSGNTGGAMMGT
jgi:energy-coupling factor transporter ATP-binding protein EcfA2